MRGILLDRDGVLNRERADYVKCWAEFEWLPGVLPALRELAECGLPIIVITNQSVIGRGITTQATIEAIHQRAKGEIEAAGGRIDDFFLCPHHPDAHCDCRKPKPGLLHQAAAKYQLALADSFFIGDAITDYQAAQTAGCQSILVESGRQGRTLRRQVQWQATQTASSTPPVVANLAAAVALILKQVYLPSTPP